MSDALRSGGVYLYVTWLTKLLAGEHECLWAAWYKGHHDYAKRQSGFDFAAWNRDHSALLRGRAQAMRDQGYQVRIENQNKFALRGRTATLGGKPDLLSIMPDHFTIDDAKTGKMRDSDACQVQLYQLFAPSIWPELTGLEPRGFIVYSDQIVPVPPIEPTFRERFAELMAKVAGHEPPLRVPSGSECGWCDVASCPARVAEAAEVATDLF